MQMVCNVGGADRIARISAGGALIGTSIFAPIGTPLRVAAGILGAFGVATGLAHYCPISQAVGANTCQSEVEEEVTETVRSAVDDY